MSSSNLIRVIDSHTAGEPTRVIVEGAPDLGSGSMAERLSRMRNCADWLRTSLTTEPRASEWMVGAVLQPPVSPDAIAGVIYFNNTGYLGMCGHGTVGVVATLSYLGRIEPGVHRLETAVGDVIVILESDGSVFVENVISYRREKAVTVQVPGVGPVVGDVAWGGNWFFLTHSDRRLHPAEVIPLTDHALRIRAALVEQGITGDSSALIDHIELLGPPSDPARADCRNFVLCPGGQYDRSPCGTGTSAKLACLAADGKLAPGQTWRQESITGTIFTGSYRPADGGVIPTIAGRAFVNGDMRLVFSADDPFRFGIDSRESL